MCVEASASLIPARDPYPGRDMRLDWRLPPTPAPPGCLCQYPYLLVVLFYRFTLVFCSILLHLPGNGEDLFMVQGGGLHDKW